MGDTINKARYIIIHVIGCSLFLVLPFLFSPDAERGRILDVFHNPHFVKDLVHYLLLAGFFYFNYYILVPRLYFEKKYLLYTIAIVTCFFLIAFLPSFLVADNPAPVHGNFQPPPGSGIRELPGFMKKPPPMGNSFFSRINHNFFLFFVVLLFSLLLRIAIRWRLSEKEKLNAELSYLKAQINPHFLFNTLNSIYSLAIEKSDNTAPAVAKLSGMMRYVITDSAREFVPLDKEIAHINSYIDLQRIRFGDNVKIIYEVTGNIDRKRIAPLILVPFIENAFKYGVNAEEDSIIEISIMIADHDKLIMNVANNKVHIQNPETGKTGTGINNTKNRLQLIYPGNHILDIKDTEKTFSVSLTLLLK